MGKTYWVYILTSRRNGTLYVGVTNDLARRVFEHRTGQGGLFTRRYGIKHLVWAEEHGEINEAIAREKQIKHWERTWKLQLIEENNPDWNDLYETLNQ